MTREEYWATFSIYDHRTPRYRQSLVLFDKAVIPVPLASTRKISEAEIDQLSADVDYLCDNGAAVRFDWDATEFDQWRESKAGEAAAQLLDKDRELATRLQLQEAAEEQLKPAQREDGGKKVTAIPVYGTLEEYRSTWENFAKNEVVEIVLDKMPLPREDTPLEDIIRLRESKAFQESMRALRRWQNIIIRDLLATGDRSEVWKATVQTAIDDLERQVTKYRKAMDDARFNKVEVGVVSILALGAALAAGGGPVIATLSALAPPAFKIKELIRPWWRQVNDEEFAAAGVVCQAEEVMK